jgi:hypothetical protein
MEDPSAGALRRGRADARRAAEGLPGKIAGPVTLVSLSHD